ncbi:MAG: amidohydrolase [Eubacteriales bacterium]|nr:amidohydrolase [Eubacteriales bacterium]
MFDLIVRNTAALLEDGSVREHVDVAVKDGRIAQLSDHDAASPKTASCVLDGYGRLLMPGLADCHMHTGQQLLKGRVLDELPMIWTRIMLPFESTLTPELMSVSAGLAALEMIRSGTTAFVDAGSYHMEEAARVYGESGLRGVLSVSTMDEPGLPPSIACTADDAVSMTEALFDVCEDYPLLKAACALRSLISCSPELIRRISELSLRRGSLLQAHMNEYPGEVNFFLQRYQLRPVEYLESLGVLGPRFISAHSLLLSEREKELFAENQVKVCHCPFSNCAKGVPDTPALLQRGICVGLGTDGAAHGGLSLWNEMKIFRSVMNAVHGVSESNPRIMPAATILDMATKSGCLLMDEPECGRIAAGCRADFITIDIRQPHLYPTGNLANTLLESVTAGDVKDMVVNGRLIMRDREILTLDEEKILWEAEQYIG